VSLYNSMQKSSYWLIGAGVLALVAVFVYLMMTRSSGGGGGGTTVPGAPSGVQLSANASTTGDCADWTADLSWTASSGSAPITYTWAFYDPSSCSGTSCSGTPVAKGTTTDTTVTLDSSQLTGFTQYMVVVTATNQWGSAASTPTSVSTGGGFEVDATDVVYMYNDTSNLLLVVGEANTALPSDGFGAALSVNGASAATTTTTYADQTTAMVAYGMQLVDANTQTLGLGLISSGGQPIVYYTPGASDTWTYTFIQQSNTGTLSSSQMLDDSETASPVALIAASTTSGTAFVLTQSTNISVNTLATLGVTSNGMLCPSSVAGCGSPTPAGSFGLIFTDVPALSAGDVLTVSISGGNSWTGSCTADLPSYTVPGTAPSAPGSIALSPP
jgi:hypothetical protein